MQGNKPMIRKLTYLLFVCLALLIHQSGLSQEEDEYDSLLIKKTIVENPVYKPVIGFGAGITHFYGDVENIDYNPFSGTYTFKVTVSTFLGGTRSFIGNFHALFGSLTGNERSYDDNPELNLNFRSDIMVFGLNAEYNFRQFFSKPEGVLRPFVSVGIENISFNSMGELRFKDTAGVNQAYHYWNDGTIRDMEETPDNMTQARFKSPNWDYETPLRESVGLGDYGKNTFAIPVDLGIDFRVSDRVKMRLGTSMHFLFTDVIDNVSRKPLQTTESGFDDDGMNDRFYYTYLTMHLDLFSEPKVITEELMFAELDDFDYSLLEDEDGDGVFDLTDECLGTPAGVEVDTLGCPYDDDNDGVPNYRDKQKDTPEGVFVNDDGMEMSEEELIARVNFPEAVPRSQLSLYLEGTITAGKRMTLAEMPEKFRKLDQDGDGYLSFNEMLTSIDDFFDFRSDMNTGEIYRLISFFFVQ